MQIDGKGVFRKRNEQSGAKKQFFTPGFCFCGNASNMGHYQWYNTKAVAGKVAETISLSL